MNKISSCGLGGQTGYKCRRFLSAMPLNPNRIWLSMKQRLCTLKGLYDSFVICLQG